MGVSEKTGRKTVWRGLGAAAVLAATAILWLGRERGPRLFVGGPVLTMDAGNRVVDALAVDGARIVAAGSRAELDAWAVRSGAQVVDLHGRALLPGFVDAHSHFPASGLFEKFCHLGSPPLGPVPDMAGLVARLKENAESSRSGDWIVGWGYDDTALAEDRHPTRRDLDLVSTDRPVVAFHISMHVATVNSKGLETLGLSASSVDAPGSRLRRDDRGEPDGVLEEEAMRPLLRAAFLPSLLEGLLATRRAARSYLAAGVTTAQNGAAQTEQISGLVRMSQAGLLPLRLVLWPEGDTALAILDGRWKIGSVDPDWLRVGASKFVADGSIQARTAYLREPYSDAAAGGTDARGWPRIPRERLFADIARVHAAGGQVAVHGNGDAVIDDILDAVEAAQQAAPRGDARPVVVHAQMVRDDQLDRMKALGAIPSFFELHTWYWGDRHRDRFLGPDRAARISPLKSALDRGIPFTLHADTPVVPMEPLRMLDAATTRRTSSGRVLGAEQRIPAMDALLALTIHAARQMFLEDAVGSLEPGKFADLVVLDRSPLEEHVDLRTLRVEETWVGGRRVYAAD